MENIIKSAGSWLGLIALFGLYSCLPYLFKLSYFLEPTEQNLEKYSHQFFSSNAKRKMHISKIVAKNFANFDINELSNPTIKAFLQDCRNGVYLIKGEKE